MSTEPTDGELYRLWRETEGIADALRAVYQAGVASQASRIEELEGERDRMVRELAACGKDLEKESDKVDTLTRELADAREELAKAKVRISNQDALLVNCRANLDALKAELAKAGVR